MSKKTEYLAKTRHLTIKQISDRINQEKKQLFVLNQEKILGKLKDVSQIKEIRKNISRAATILDEKLTNESEK